MGCRVCIHWLLMLVFFVGIVDLDGFPLEDLVVGLPGQPKVGFRQFSGYIDVDVKVGRSLFYYFVEAQQDPHIKPLTLWLNGGPGCSSLGGGAFTELGPFFPAGDASNLLFVESPAGVGWSYSNTSYDYNTGDASTANDMHMFMMKWYEKFPAFKSRDLFLTGESYAGIAKQNLRAKSPELMKKFSVLRLASGAIQRAEDKPLPLPPKDSATVEKGLEDVPSEQEALRLLEERKQVHIPDESERVVPPQTRGATKKSGKKKRKRDSSSHKEKSAKRPSVGAVPTARPLQIRPVEEETSPLQDSPRPSSDKGKEKMGESSAAPSSQYAEVYRRREVSPFRRDTPFPELGHKGLVVRFNRATSNLISKVDVDLLESMPPRDRVRQAQASAAEVITFKLSNMIIFCFRISLIIVPLQAFIRLAFELDANRQSAADQETMAALTSRCEELNEELTKLREDLPSLKEKLAKCSELKERLVRTEQWRERARKQLDQIVENLDAASTRSASISHEVGLLMDTHAKLVHQNQQLMQQVSADSSHFKMILSAAKVYKLCLTRKARIARDWLLSDEPEASKFLGDLTAEMVKAGTMISDEKYRLAAAELGMDFTSLQQTAEQKGSEALSNLAPVLDGESAVLVDTVWDATEKRAWSEKINAEAEREALSLDLEQLALSSPPASDVPENLTLSNLEVLCLDLSNLIIDEGRNLQSLSRELSEIGVEPFNVEDYVSFTPSFEEGRIESPPPPGEDVEAFFDDV
ncbi:uncharacterized protein LOC130806469 isoform X4 [Amaranthus tricolor]|uniref:uncharacterized protein LOC130806469 isoform X4 n=1 Tax=Amaranthus tricolor TaxID=29722 RepID=UPI00258F70D5|nr:uncharacterized protein LOC130806469 isoform X4 [Amaranthus tricolor]